MPIGEPKDIKKFNLWVRTCGVLHNFLLAVGDKPDASWLEGLVIPEEHNARKNHPGSSRVLDINKKQYILNAPDGPEKRERLKNLIK